MQFKDPQNETLSLGVPEVLGRAGLAVAEGDADVPVPLEELSLVSLAGQGGGAHHALPLVPPVPLVPPGVCLTAAWLLLGDFWITNTRVT